jgi:hypothetical protein
MESFDLLLNFLIVEALSGSAKKAIVPQQDICYCCANFVVFVNVNETK